MMSSAHLNKFSSVKPAEIEWRDDLPFNCEFNDIYFSNAGGVAESRHVFIAGNQLVNDWSNSQQSRFNLLELGFGTGLNFLVTALEWQHWQNTQPVQTSKQLHYLAIEMRPLQVKDLIRACSHWPEFNQISQQLIQLYPSLTYGRHTLNFAKLNLTLTLLFMPVNEALDDLLDESLTQENKTQIDHWFLDGFAPQKNDAMWNQSTCLKVARLSKSGSRVATFSVASTVKDALRSAGFHITKRKGIGRKREVLSGQLTELPPAPKLAKHINLKFEQPWLTIQKQNPGKSIAVIGAGLAGCATAYALSRQGFSIDLFDSRSQIATQASGAAAGIFHPNLTPDMNIASQFHWLAYLYLLRFINQLDSKEQAPLNLNWGLTRLLPSRAHRNQLLDLSQKLGLQKWFSTCEKLNNNARAINFPFCASLDIGQFCQLLLNKIPPQFITKNLSCEITDLYFAENQWQLTSKTQKFNYDSVIFCGGANSQLLDKFAPDITHFSRGQSCDLSLPDIKNKIKTPLCEQIYLVPQSNGSFYLGATFDNFIANELLEKSQLELLDKLANMLIELDLPVTGLQEKTKIPLQGTLGYRLHTQDRLPLVGGVVDINKLQGDFFGLGQKRIERTKLSHYSLPGLWLNTAYGSHGLLFALLASEHLAALVTHGISPLDSRIAKALHPARFNIKKLKQ